VSDNSSEPTESSSSSLPVTLPSSSADWRELVAVILISVTTILPAWTAFQASKWGGSMSINFSQASAARIDAARFESDANRQASVHVALFTQWLSAQTTENEKLAVFLREAFPEPLATALSDWLDERAVDAQAAPQTPFDMPSYVLDNAVRAEEKQAQAEQLSARALTSNRNSDNYTVLTILFATVLFFAAVSNRVKKSLSSWTLIGVALVVFVGSATVLASLPKLF
jgi:hypothetical protein